MDQAELLAKLNDLRSLPAETEWAEFKRAERSFQTEDLGKYFSALSNEANLKGQSYAWLVFGIEDKTHQIVGTQFRIRRSELDNLKLEIATQTTNRLTFEEIHELQTPQGRVVLFQIPASPKGVPTAWKGHFYGRDGESLGALSLYEIERIRSQTQTFEQGIALSKVNGQDVVDLLDCEAYFRLTGQRLPDTRSRSLARLVQEKLLIPNGHQFDITNLCAIFFARDLTSFGRLGRKTLRVIKYKGGNRIETDREWRDSPSKMGYAAGFEWFIQYINSQLPQNEYIGQAFRHEVRTYPEVAIRELVANALIHQDFLITGAGPMVEIFEDRMEITNPGEPLVEVSRFIDSPPRSRNEDLAGYMRRFNICEERGSGIDKVIINIELFQLPPPDFRVPPGFTQVWLFSPQSFSEMDRKERVRACYQHCALGWIANKPMTSGTLRQRFGVTNPSDHATVSRIIRDAVEQNLVKKENPHSNSKKNVTYAPFWA